MNKHELYELLIMHAPKEISVKIKEIQSKEKEVKEYRKCVLILCSQIKDLRYNLINNV